MTNKMATDRVLALVFSVLLTILQICEADRKVSWELLSGPNITQPEYTIAHITAAGANDELHYLLSSLGFPTILVARTKPATKVTVNWDRFINETERANSITFPSGNVIYSYSLFFTKLIDYNDTKDYSDLTKYTPESTMWNIYNLNEFSWERFVIPPSDVQSIEFKATNKTNKELWQYNGVFSIKLTPYVGSGRESQLPHLVYNENIVQLDLTIDHVWTNFSKSRFAIELVMVAGDNSPMKIDQSKSIDDEYTPGVFYINNLLTKPDSDTGGFLQWKPVCYKKLDRARSDATYVRHYQVQEVDLETTDVLRSSVLYAVNGDGFDKMSRVATNISFGLTEDGGYNKTQVLTWSASLGYGIPPKDSVSTIVIIIILSGLGIPVVLILFGGVFVCVKKKKSKSTNVDSNGYQRIGTN